MSSTSGMTVLFFLSGDSGFLATIKLSFGYDHSIFDANCGPMFYKLLADRLAAVTGDMPSNIVPTSCKPLRSPIEELL